MVLCADDFGLSSSVNKSILELSKKGRLSAVSCLMTHSSPQDQVQALLQLKDDLDIGLHFNLTENDPSDHSQRYSSLGGLAVKAGFGLLSKARVKQELDNQFQKFRSVFGKAPDFIDGHMHVQQLPVVSTVLVGFLKEVNFKGYVRTGQLSIGTFSSILRKLPMSVSGYLSLGLSGGALAKSLQARGYRTNGELMGYYYSGTGARFEQAFQTYCSLRPTPKDIFFCHPGSGTDATDPINKERQQVYELLNSASFEQILNSYQISLNRFPGS